MARARADREHVARQLVRMGKVLYLGISNAYGWQIHQMQNYALSKNVSSEHGQSHSRNLALTRHLSDIQQAGFSICQPLHNAVYREAEKEIFAVCKVSHNSVWISTALTRPASPTALRHRRLPLVAPRQGFLGQASSVRAFDRPRTKGWWYRSHDCRWRGCFDSNQRGVSPMT